jgi:CDP-glucose 4,6-dehydratase
MEFRSGALEGVVTMDARFWNGKKVLITGHTGFKGSWLSLWLQRLGANVSGYALRLPTEPSLFDVAHVAANMDSVTGDIRDLDRLNKVISDRRSEIVIHMAAQTIVRSSYADPIATYSTNVMGTANVLEAVRLSRTARVVLIVTSDKCYQDQGWLWGYRENDPMGGQDPYAGSKGCAELVKLSYISSYFALADYTLHGVAVASVRAGNAIGGGDWAPDRLIPDVIRAVTAGRPVVIRNPNSVRPWQHVLDPLNGYLTLAQRLWESGPSYVGAWNFGPNGEDAKPVQWVVERILSMWGNGLQWKPDKGIHPAESTYLIVDSTKARRLLGWSTKLRLHTALEWVVEWYKRYRQGSDMRYMSEAEIKRFEEL